MSLVITDARASVKARLSIPAADTSFDSLISTLIGDNVKRLYPRLQVEVDKQTASVTPVHGEANINLTTLTTPLVGVRRVEVTGDMGEFPVSDVYQHKTNLRLRELPSGSSTVHIYGLVRPTLDNLDDEFHLALIFYTMADFYRYLVGDRRKYNEYMTNGAPATDEMADLADYWEKLAEKELDDHAPRYGHQ